MLRNRVCRLVFTLLITSALAIIVKNACRYVQERMLESAVRSGAGEIAVSFLTNWTPRR